MRPRDLVKAWVEAFNRGDPDEMTLFYDEDAVNHQMPREPAEGRAAIREMFARDFAEAEMECIVENIFEDGDWRFWDGVIRWECADAGSSLSKTTKSLSNVDIGTSCHF